MAPTLVLGASGFLGAHVVAAAVARNLRAASDRKPARVVALGREVLLAPRFTARREAAEWVSHDLAPAGAVGGFLDAERPRRVVLCAALARVAACEENPALARRMNAEIPGEVARWCAQNRARLVHVSTDLVFGAAPPPPTGFAEDAAVGPLSVYGETKRAGEDAVLAACPAALVVRLPLLYGNSGGRGLGASDSLLEAIERGETPRLFVDECRTPLEVSNAAEALVELAAGKERGVLHVAGPDRVSRHALGLAVLEAMEVPPEEARQSVSEARQADVPTRSARPADVSPDARRARRILETPLLGVEAGTRRASA